MIATYKRILSWLATTAMAAVGCAAETGETLPSEPSSGLSVRLAALESGGGRIEYSLSNHGAEPVRVLAWKTALYSAPDPLFAISREGSAIEYEGPILHRVRVPKPSHYVEVAPGQRLSAVVDLTQSYNLKNSGVYEVRLLPLQASFVLGRNAIALDSDASVRIEIDAQHAARVGVRSAALTPANCTSEHYEELAATEREALANLEEATQYFADHGYDERAVRWFGSADSEQDSDYVGSGLSTIRAWLERGSLEYNCDAGGWCDNDSTVAWVDPIFSPGVINLCDEFWASDAGGHCARAVSVTHELAHFFTQSLDWTQYSGPTRALALAQNYPAFARSNAENYALYTIDAQIPPNPTDECVAVTATEL
jgi:peptidyl-Lys metalloendopeptidase